MKTIRNGLKLTKALAPKVETAFCVTGTAEDRSRLVYHALLLQYIFYCLSHSFALLISRCSSVSLSSNELLNKSYAIFGTVCASVCEYVRAHSFEC